MTLKVSVTLKKVELTPRIGTEIRCRRFSPPAQPHQFEGEEAVG
ncbi:MAG: hypothetical protein U1D00_17785 [Mycobacterium sp.]|nr:hypothetical protein [Mycobacterium sp.]